MSATQAASRSAAPSTSSATDAANARRGSLRVLTAAGIDAAERTPRELRHSFVSLLSDSGMTVDQIARLVGHAGGSSITELVYRKQIRPVIDDGDERPVPQGTAMVRQFDRQHTRIRRNPWSHPAH